MKNYICIITLSILLLNLMTGCNKSNADAAKKDYAASFTNKTWAGEFSYTAQKTQYYSVHFNADKSLTWSELSGDYSGHWVVDGKQLVLTFTSGSQIKADISDDDQLINITDNTDAWEVTSGKLVPKTDFVLENTIWKGNLTFGSLIPLELNFSAGLKVKIYAKDGLEGVFTYTRSASGGSILVGSGDINFFGVVTGDNEIKGSYYSADSPWQAAKQ